MKTSTMQAGNLRPIISRIVIARVCSSVMGGIAMTPAFARDNDQRAGHRDNGKHKVERHADRDWRGYQEPYYYAQAVYAPPPDYYAPQQSPGVSVFLPLNIRIR